MDEREAIAFAGCAVGCDRISDTVATTLPRLRRDILLSVDQHIRLGRFWKSVVRDTCAPRH